MISEKSIIEVKDALRIEDVVGDVVALKRHGVSLTGCCPFHNEKTPSFVVNSSKGFYKCFGCGESGDAIAFVMKTNNMSYPEAIEKLAAKYNVHLELTDDNRTKEQIESERQKKDTATLLLNTASLRYQKELKNHPTVKSYLLEQRQWNDDTIAEWGIGFAPHSDFLHGDILKSKKVTTAEEIGLIRIFGDKMYDAMNKRITFPICDHRAQLIGLAGRLIDNSDKEHAKYINPKDSFLYNKSRVLFGLDKAINGKAFKLHGWAILTEGYADVISMHQCGYNNTVASCGTALTKEQAKLLRKQTDTVIVMRDGDKAGIAATLKDIDILISEDFKVYVILLPEGKDPDDMCKEAIDKEWVKNCIRLDAVLWKLDKWFGEAKDELEKSMALDAAGLLLAMIPNETLRGVYLESTEAKHKLKKKLKAAIDKAIKRIDKQKEQEEAEKQTTMKLGNVNFPEWVDETELYENGFVQLHQERNGDKVGIYFKLSDDYLKRLTNFTVQPLYHIYETSNNRRLVKVHNGRKTAVIEMPTRAFISMDMFLTELMNKGAFTIEPSFTKLHFIRLIGWLSEQMPHCWELKTLGWQAEGFFAYANKVAIPNDEGIILKDYDEMGIVEVNNQHYISLSASAANSDNRMEDNMYENDMYLKYVQSPVSFTEWANKFSAVYGPNAEFGIVYIFISLFKDVVTATTKCPILYSYGPKGSGKSEFSESLLWFFFSGKNGEGKLMQGYNLNPGQGTPFSFFNLQSRFRNVILHFNEFDENNIEDWKFGSFKAFYDGQGREVGDGSTGKARKTTVQKTQGTMAVAGQYLSTRDDGSVLSRSITAQFTTSRVDSLTEQQIADYKLLKEWELKGLSSLICELLKHRNYFAKEFSRVYWEEFKYLNDEVRQRYGNAETRLIKNYAACLAVYKVMGKVLTLPFKYEEFFSSCMKIVIGHNALLKENNSLGNFWKSVEILFDRKLINHNLKTGEQWNVEFAVVPRKEIQLKSEGRVYKMEFESVRKLLIVRFSLLFSSVAKHTKDQGKKMQDESTLLKYLQDQPYYVGLTPTFRFHDKPTSAFVIDYDAAALQLEGNAPVAEEGKLVDAPSAIQTSLGSDDLPF